jgi:hypothetical protein
MLYKQKKEKQMSNSCNSHINAYPYGPTLQVLPLFQMNSAQAPGYSPALAAKAQANLLNDNTILNIDGIPIKIDPCKYQCSLDHLNQVQPVMFQTGMSYTNLGGVITAPQFYYSCGRKN